MRELTKRKVVRVRICCWKNDCSALLLYILCVTIWKLWIWYCTQVLKRRTHNVLLKKKRDREVHATLFFKIFTVRNRSNKQNILGRSKLHSICSKVKLNHRSKWIKLIHLAFSSVLWNCNAVFQWELYAVIFPLHSILLLFLCKLWGNNRSLWPVFGQTFHYFMKNFKVSTGFKTAWNLLYLQQLIA